jgi:archaemetzincin
LSGCITICPVGLVDEDILNHVTNCIEMRCKVTCTIGGREQNPAYAYDEQRDQYNSMLVLERLTGCCPPNTMKFIGLTGVDLFIPILKFVFGLSQIDGMCAVVSSHRLRPEFYGEPPDRALLLDRIEKTVMHELGHCMTLTHCRDRRCVMYSSTRIEDTDRKGTDFCPTCAELFRWHMERISKTPHP